MLPSFTLPSADAGPVIQLVDLLLSELFSAAPGVLAADLEPRDGAGRRPAPAARVRWVIRSVEVGEPERVLMEMPARLFRPCLARVGGHFLGGQLYGGHARCRLVKDGRAVVVDIHLSNDSLGGFWVRVCAGATARA